MPVCRSTWNSSTGESWRTVGLTSRMAESSFDLADPGVEEIINDTYEPSQVGGECGGGLMIVGVGLEGSTLG